MHILGLSEARPHFVCVSFTHPPLPWLLQYSALLGSFCARINHSFVDHSHLPRTIDSEAVLGVWLPAPLPTPRALPDHGAIWPLAVGVEKDFGRYRCLTLRYSLLLSVWVDPSAEHSFCTSIAQYLTRPRPPICIPCTIPYRQWQYRV